MCQWQALKAPRRQGHWGVSLKCNRPGGAFVIACKCARARRTSDGHHDLPLERRAVSLRVSPLRAQRHSERQLAWGVPTGLCEADWTAPSGRRAAGRRPRRRAHGPSGCRSGPGARPGLAEDPELPPKAPGHFAPRLAFEMAFPVDSQGQSSLRTLARAVVTGHYSTLLPLVPPI
jgi:hypothetical protein